MAQGKLESRIYKDIDLDFLIHPKTGDIAKKTDVNSIKQSVRNLVLFGIHDKPFHPEINGGITDLLFEPMDKITAGIIETTITRVINNYEPRIKLEGVSVEGDEDNNKYEVRVVFSFVNDTDPIEIDFLLERVK